MISLICLSDPFCLDGIVDLFVWLFREWTLLCVSFSGRISVSHLTILTFLYSRMWSIWYTSNDLIYISLIIYPILEDDCCPPMISEDISNKLSFLHLTSFYIIMTVTDAQVATAVHLRDCSLIWNRRLAIITGQIFWTPFGERSNKIESLFVGGGDNLLTCLVELLAGHHISLKINCCYATLFPHV